MGPTRDPFDPAPRAFISYARSDGEAFASNLRLRLKREEPEITLWQDRERMEGGIGWWKQITDAIDRVEFLLMVMTPNVMTSEVARREWRYARQQGVRVCPIKGAADSELDFSVLPNWMRKTHFYDLEREWSTFVGFLKSAGKEDRVPFMAPDVREDFVQRPAEFESLIASLLDPTRTNPVAITTSIRGSGGFGKTTLATALCHQPDVVNAFDDGILWATLGEHPNPQRELTRLYAALTGDRPPFVDAEDASIQLAAKLEDKQCLLVIDDVWSPDHVKPFLRGGKTCARLITTRLQPVVTEVGAHGVLVNQMTSEQSVELLTAKLEPIPADLEPFKKLAKVLGEWPLLLRLAGSQIRERLARGDSLDGALAYVNRAVEKHGPIAFDRQSDAVAKTVSASLDILPPEDRLRCAELAIFPEDTPIPVTTARALWQLDEFDAEEVAQRLDGAALVDFDLKVACIRIHGVLRWHLRQQLHDEPSLHARLVHQGFRNPYELPDSYAWRWIGWHLAKAGELEMLSSLLQDFRWLEAKLRATDAEALIQDFELARAAPELRVLHDCLRLAANGLTQDPGQLAAQLKGRLDSGRWEGIDRLLVSAEASVSRPWLTFSHTSLTRPGGALTGILKGHSKTVESVVLSSDGRRALSGSGDWNVRHWNLDTGRSLRILEGHQGLVHCVAFSPDERQAASGSEDRSIRLWNLERGSPAALLRGHYGAVTAIAFSPDGRLLASVSDDGTARLWDVPSALAGSSGKPRLTHKANSHQLHAVAFTTDGRRVLFGAGDWTIVMLDIESASVVQVLEAHTGIVKALALSNDGRTLVSGSQDETLRIWDLESGGVLHVLEGHAESVDGVAVTPDGRRAVSGSADQSVRVWDLKTGQVLRVLEGHSSEVRSVALSRDGTHALSSSADTTIRHWNLEIDVERLPVRAHSHGVSFLAISADGLRAISGSRAGALHLWNADSDRVAGVLGESEAHSDAISSLRMSADGRTAVTASRDKSLRVWDLTTNRALHVLSGHSRAVRSLQTSADLTRAVTLSGDKTLRLWDLVKGRQLRGLAAPDTERDLPAQRPASALLSELGLDPSLDLADFQISPDAQIALAPDGSRVAYGSYSRLCCWDLETGATRCEDVEDFGVVAVAMAPDARYAVFGARFGRLCVWDLHAGKTMFMLEGHSGDVLDIVSSPDGKSVITAARDDTIRIWDLETGREGAVLPGRGGNVDTVAIAPNGAYAYAIYGDTVVALSVARRTRIGSLSLDHQITALAVTPDGERLALGDQSGRVHFLRVLA